jgi:hypothetical protein
MFHRIAVTGLQWWLYSCMILAGVVALILLFIETAGKKVFPVAEHGESSRAHLLVYTLLPLSVAFEIAFHVERMLTLCPQILFVLGRQMGLGLDLPVISASVGLIKFIQSCLILLGTFGSLVVLKKLIGQNARQHDAPNIGLLQRLPSLLIGVCYLMLFMLK